MAVEKGMKMREKRARKLADFDVGLINISDR